MYRLFMVPNVIVTLQVLQTRHLLCGVLCISGLEGILVAMKTVGQALTPPHLVSDSENPSATTVG